MPSRKTLRGGVLVALWVYTIVAGFYILYAPALYLMLLDHGLYRRVVDQIFALWQLYPVALHQCIFDTKVDIYGDLMNSEETSVIIMNHRTRLDWNYAWLALYHAEQRTTTIPKVEVQPETSPIVDLRPETYQNNSQEPAPNVNPKERRANIISENKILSTEHPANSIWSKFLSNFDKKAMLKYVLKDEIKYIPCIGWIMQLNHFLYLRRRWSEDQSSMWQWLKYYRRLNYKIKVLIFPEGTDLSRENQLASDHFAAANNKPPYDFVLHPRTTGFAVLCSRLLESGGLDAVYDATLTYDSPPTSELDVLKGEYPGRVSAYIKRYAASELPREETRLRRWLTDRWSEKESCLRHYHNEGRFTDAHGKEPTHHHPMPLTIAKCAFVFWTILDILFLVALTSSSWFQFWISYNTLLFALVTWHFGGFQNVQITLFH